MADVEALLIQTYTVRGRTYTEKPSQDSNREPPCCDDKVLQNNCNSTESTAAENFIDTAGVAFGDVCFS